MWEGCGRDVGRDPNARLEVEGGEVAEAEDEDRHPVEEDGVGDRVDRVWRGTRGVDVVEVEVVEVVEVVVEVKVEVVVVERAPGSVI